MKKNNTNQLNVSDFTYILDEIERFTKGYYCSTDANDLKKFLESEPKMSLFCKMPMSQRADGEISIGHNADDRFFTIAKRIRVPEKHKVKRSVTDEQLVSYLKIEFSKLIIEQKNPVDESTSSKIISKATNAALKENRSITHYIPLLFFSDYNGEELEFGSVKIIGSHAFTVMCVENEQLRNEVWSKEYWDETDFSKFFKNFNAVMCIDVPSCEKNISRERALLSAKTFVGIMHLFFGRKYSKHVNVFGQLPLERRAFEVTEESNEFHIVENGQFGGADAKNWRDVLSADNDDLTSIYSQSIGVILNPKQHEVLGNRVIDSLLWFSEGITDKYVLSRVVKYSISIERLLTIKTGDPLKKENDISKNIEDRASKILSIFEGNREEWRGRIKHLYELRSDIVHGTLSISSTFEDHSDYWPEILAQKIIMATTIFYSKLGLEENRSPKYLAQKFKELELL